ncbi:hypothetical protein LJR030_001516 [Rhizobium sp. LjRoot30]|uniref:hypothetical protein n=1 Tax=Rhizobium sp. LjRoot30 TaxID=3342320 RepID=UPI003ECF939E
MTDEDYHLYTAYLMAGDKIRGRHGFRIPALVMEQWERQGYAVLRTNTLARHYGVGRKTMWRTIQAAINAGFIHEIGRTAEGKAMYIPCFERGREWQASREMRASGSH